MGVTASRNEAIYQICKGGCANKLLRLIYSVGVCSGRIPEKNNKE